MAAFTQIASHEPDSNNAQQQSFQLFQYDHLASTSLVAFINWHGARFEVRIATIRQPVRTAIRISAFVSECSIIFYFDHLL